MFAYGESLVFFTPECDITVNFKISLPKIELTKMSENNTNKEKVDLGILLMEMANEVLEGEGKGLRLRVEEVNAGIIVRSDSSAEVIKSPAYKEDIKENTSLLIDTKVREIMRGLLNRVLIKLHINERKEVLIKSKEVHEAEILESDLNSGGKISEETKKMLEEKSHQISEAVRVALEQMMRRMIALRKENIGMIAEEIYNLLKERGELSISEIISETKTPPHIAYLGMGWLAREDKLEFVKREGRNFVHLT